MREQVTARPRGATGAGDATVAQRKAAMESFLSAERARRPGTRIVLNERGLPKLYLRDGGTLTGTTAGAAEDVAKNFLRAQPAVFGLSGGEIDGLRLTVKDATPEATFLVFNQTLNGIDVFEGQVKFTLTPRGEIVQAAMGEISPGLNLSTVPRLRAEDAVRAALTAAAIRKTAGALERLSGADRAATFRNPLGGSYGPIRAELCVFALDAATARLAYRIFLETGPQSWYEMVVDAANGGLLYRHNLYVSAAQGFVWTQSPMQSGRAVVTFPDAWLPTNGVVTTGNNTDVYIDTDADDQPDALTTGDFQNGRVYSPSRNFNFPFGDGLSGQDPRLTKAAAATNLFYFLNTAHDYYYSLGFTEAAGAFQTDKFGKGGIPNDAVLGEAQFGGFTNNAAFAPTPEGVAPRIRMGLYTRGTPDLTDDLDPDYDGEVVIHEYGHGVSNRLVGGGASTSCLNRIQSGALGEGWSDYFSISYFNNPVEGAYLTQNPKTGIRRQSYEGYTFTYEDIGNAGYEVHNDGEIWAATLWDLRKALGQSVTDKLVLSGLKSTPCHPSMTDARDALISADQATNAGANRAVLWQIFARHGLGYSALGVDGTQITGTRYDAAGDLPADLQSAGNPAVTSNPLLVTGNMGSPYLYTISASNPNGGTLSFALSQGPSGMTVDAASGAVNWTAGFLGQRVKIVITDGKGGRLAHGYLLPVVTNLTSGTPLVVQADAGTAGYAALTVPSGVPALQVTLRGGTGDADLLTDSPSGDVEFSGRDGNTETLTFANPKPGIWLIQVDGYAAYSAVKLAGAFVTPPVLGLNTTVVNEVGAISSETLYRIPVPAGATSLHIGASGGTGDVDLFLKYGSPALCQEADAVSTPCVFDYASTNEGNNDAVNVSSPNAGDWYLDLAGFDDYAGVTLTTATVVPPTLVVTPGTLSFAAVQGGAAPPSQSVSISNAAGTTYTWAARTSTVSGGNWLQAGQTSGNADGALSVSVNGAGLSPGSYQGALTVTSAGLAGSPRTVTVSLTVSSAPSLTVTPSSLTFQTVSGQDASPQTLTITNGGGGTLNWTDAATTAAGGNWLQVSAGSGSGNGSVQVSIRGAGLAAGNYSGTITINAPGAANSPAVIPVSVTVFPAAPIPTIATAGVTGAGGSTPAVTQISPGGFATVKGANFAPAGTSQAVQSTDFVNGNLPTQLAGVCVDVDGLPAYLTYVGANQVNFVVPSVRTGVSVNVQVRTRCGQSGEVRSAAVAVSSQTASPEFLYWAHPDNGQNPVIAVNAVTGTYVGPTSVLGVLTPAKPGDYLTIYGVSFGPTTPSYAPGTPPTGTGTVPGPATVQLGTSNLSADHILYTGVSPGTAGLYQLNIQIPDDVADGNYPLTLTFSGFSTPAGYLQVQH